MLASLAFKAFILELFAVDGLAPGPVAVGEVSTLAHEAYGDQDWKQQHDKRDQTLAYLGHEYKADPTTRLQV
jgi:hypothetical protein